MRALAYIRRSASGEAQASEETQRATVARLAEQRGEHVDRVYRDWGRSGGDEARPQYLAMMAEVEAGTVSTIYAYDQDRLARDNWIFAGLLRAADRHDFAIVTPAGDLTDEDHRDFVEMRGVMDGGELRKMRKRNRATRDRCKARGDRYGAVPFGYARRTPKLDGSERVEVYRDRPEAIAHVVDAYRRDGTYSAAARALNGEGFTTDRGKEWHPTTVRDVVRREAPELAQDVRRGTRGPARKRYLAGILRCHCGHVMTPGGALDWPLYYCHRGQRDPSHARPLHVKEARLLPAIMAEAERFRLPSRVEVETAAEYDDSDKRRRLEAARDLMSEDAYAEALGKLEADAEAHGARLTELLDVPERIDWTWPPEHVNAVLRTLWHAVPLGADLLPAWPADDAHWRLPAEYIA